MQQQSTQGRGGRRLKKPGCMWIWRGHAICSRHCLDSTPPPDPCLRGQRGLDWLDSCSTWNQWRTYANGWSFTDEEIWQTITTPNRKMVEKTRLGNKPCQVATTGNKTEMGVGMCANRKFYIDIPVVWQAIILNHVAAAIHRAYVVKNLGDQAIVHLQRIGQIESARKTWSHKELDWLYLQALGAFCWWWCCDE